MHETITPSSATASAIPAVMGTRVEFSGDRPEFRQLVLRGAFLELITLGFYRFWLATDIRRHLWSHTSVGDDSCEYTGSAKELLLGFLFALAIFAPIYVLYFFAGIEAERLQAFASILFILFFFLFAQFAIYRARRYRVTRTVWRGVRFWMTGSGVGYAWRAALWGALIIVSLGLALPWARAALERYKMRHTGYGDLQGRFEGTGWELFKRSWHLWLLAWPSLVVVIPLPFVYGAFKAIEWRWWIDGLRVGGVRFKSDLRTGALIGLYWKIIGWTALLLLGLSGLIGAVFFGVIWAGKTAEQIAASNDVPTFIFSVLTYAITALVFGALMRIYLMRDIWQRVASSMTVYGLAAANDVAAHGELASSLGEGFADSLDVGF